MSDTRTIAAQLTPRGRGAVATIAVRGPRASEYVSRHFVPPGSATAACNRICFGTWLREAALVGEELVICRTQDDTIEIHCHGGSAAVAAILADLRVAGAEIVDGSAWIALITPDPIAADALVALADARTERTAGILLDQFRGALTEELRLIQSLMGPKTRTAAVQRIDLLLARGHLGLHLTRPFRVVLAGSPNVGKSRLINALLGYDRSIVFDQPGTTRDVVSALTALDGWPVELSDTAGIRDTSDLIEAAGVERASQQLSAADLVLWVRDATQMSRASVPTGSQARVIVVGNKSDLLPETVAPDSGLLVSAKTGAGLDLLKDRIVQSLIPCLPARGAAVPFKPEHLALLQELRQQAMAAPPSIRG